MEPLFAGQLERCGVDYFGYYLLHNVNWMRYTQIIREARLFDHMTRWKELGKLRHISEGRLGHSGGLMGPPERKTVSTLLSI